MNRKGENLIDIIKTLKKRQKVIFITCIIAFVGSVIISLLLSNYYKASVVLYPSNPGLTDRNILFGNAEKSMQYFGGKEELERLIAIANSTELADYVINKYNLYEHYDIDSAATNASHKIQLHFRGLYEVIKNKYGALEVYVEDKDKVLAAEMANDIVAKIDAINLRLIQSDQNKILKAYETDLATKQTSLDLLTDSLQILRKRYGIFDVTAQSELLTSLVTRTESSLAAKKAKLEIISNAPRVKRDSVIKLKAAISSLEGKLYNLTDPNSKSNFNLARFNAGLSLVEMLEAQHRRLREDLAGVGERYMQFSAAINSDISTVRIVEHAYVPRIKSRPKRMIIVATALLVAFIFTTIGILLFDTYSDVWKAIKDEA